MWQHSPGDGCATEYHYWTPAVGRLLQHGSGLPPVGGTTGTGVGAHRDSTRKLNDPGLGVWTGVNGTGERFPAHVDMVATSGHGQPKMLVTIHTVQHDGGGKWSLLVCFSSQQTNSIIAATLKTTDPSIEHNLPSCVAVKEKRTRS